MIFHFTVFWFSAVFFGMLTFLVRNPIVPSWPWYGLSLFVFVLLSLAASRKLTGKWYPAFLPSVVSFSTLLLISLIDVVFEQRVFIWVTTALFYASLLGIYRLKLIPTDETARALLKTAALASLFFSYAAAYGLYLNYDVPLSLLMFVFFLASAIVAFQTLYWVGRDDVREVLLMSLALGAVMGELVWTVHFWPFGYLTIGSAMLIFFFLMWRCILDLLRDNFVWRRMAIESIILVLLLALLIVTSPWRMQA
jgi:hypothetical protein